MMYRNHVHAIIDALRWEVTRVGHPDDTQQLEKAANAAVDLILSLVVVNEDVRSIVSGAVDTLDGVTNDLLQVRKAGS